MAGLNSDTKLLIHADGSDGSTSFTDESESNHTITAVGTAQKDTAEKKFGTASLLLDGDSDYLSIPDSEDWDIFKDNTDDWTIDFWFKNGNVYQTYHYLMYRGEDADNWFGFYHHKDDGFYVYFKKEGTYYKILNGGRIDDHDWHHVAMCKVADEYGLYLDGAQGSYNQETETTILEAELWIGHNSGSYYTDGWLDEIRIQHSNYFDATPQSDNSDTIDVPTEAYYSEMTGILPLFRPA